MQDMNLKDPPYKREVIAEGAWGQIVRITLKPGQVTPPHKHSLPVIGVVVQGHPFEISDPGGYRDFAPGERFEQPPNAIHMVGNPLDAEEDAIFEDSYPPGKLRMETFPGFFDTPAADRSPTK